MDIERLFSSADPEDVAERAEEDKRRAEDAKQLLRHPLLREALREIESRLIEQLALVDVAPERVARLQSILAAKRVFERYLTSTVETGTLVLEQERQRQSITERLRSMVSR